MNLESMGSNDENLRTPTDDGDHLKGIGFHDSRSRPLGARQNQAIVLHDHHLWDVAQVDQQVPDDQA
jgi:hypothetical protein